MTCATCAPTAHRATTAAVSAASPTRWTPSGSRARRWRIRCCRERSRPPGEQAAPDEQRELLCLWHNKRRSLLKSRQHLLNEAEFLLADLPLGAARVAARQQGRAPAAGRAWRAATAASAGTPRPRCGCGCSTTTAPRSRGWTPPSATPPGSLRLLVAAADTTLGELCGLSTRSVAELLVEVGDPRRFTEGGFARFNGTAPLAASTAEGPGEPVRHRFNPGGNRRVNAILHRMAVTQLRCEPRAQAIYHNARARGHTKREARRILKRHLCRRHPPPHDTRPRALRRPCPLGRLTAPTRDAVTGAARQGRAQRAAKRRPLTALAQRARSCRQGEGVPFSV